MTDKTDPKGQQVETRPCPKCGADMMQGEMSAGRSAWACTNFPKCGHIEMVRTPEEQAILDRLEKGTR
jgi:ssDNA-binding Zn-finger/Zn-ribbon topoisomerase 1